MAEPGPVKRVHAQTLVVALLAHGRALRAQDIYFTGSPQRDLDAHIGPGLWSHVAIVSRRVRTSDTTSVAPHAGQTSIASETGGRLAARRGDSTARRTGGTYSW